MTKRSIFLMLCCAFVLDAQPTANHHLTTDTEVGSEGSVTQYVLYDYGREGKTVGISGLVLALRADDGSQFLQFAAGPDFHRKHWFVNTYFGGAKGGRLIAIALGEVELPSKLKLTVGSDFKPQSPIGHLGYGQEIWFSRAWLGCDNVFWGVDLYVRHDNLQAAGHGDVSGKLGGEIRKRVRSRIQLYSFIARDYQKHETVVTAGLRFKILGK